MSPEDALEKAFSEAREFRPYVPEGASLVLLDDGERVEVAIRASKGQFASDADAAGATMRSLRAAQGAGRA